MSDFFLKFWPKENVTEDKTKAIEEGLSKAQIIGDPTEFWGDEAFKPGRLIQDYFEPLLSREDQYFETITITIESNGYGVSMGKEDFNYIDRLNVIAVKGGEGTFQVWNKMCQLLEDITGDVYVGGWEFL